MIGHDVRHECVSSQVHNRGSSSSRGSMHSEKVEIRVKLFTENEILALQNRRNLHTLNSENKEEQNEMKINIKRNCI